MDSSSHGIKRKRAQKACLFCHQRKMKCNNESPQCSDCIAHEQTCTYIQEPKKARPSNDRIACLEAENRQLRASLRGGRKICEQCAQNTVQTTRTSQESPVAQSRLIDDESITEENHGLGPELGKIPVNVDFHGPSSILFDKDASRIGNLEDSDSFKQDGAPISSELMVAAATQRQAESTHFSTQQVDTDGVHYHLAEELLDAFWKSANSALMVVYRPGFMRDWACRGPLYSKLLLNAIYHTAARQSGELSMHRSCGDRINSCTKFRHRFQQLLQQDYDRSSITTIQALLVMSSSISAIGDDRSLAWLYSGMAYRMIIDLGFHTGGPSSAATDCKAEEGYELQKRIFWSAFDESDHDLVSTGRSITDGRAVIDKLQSFYHGRPPNLQEANISVPFALRDHYDELEQWAPMDPSFARTGGYSPTYSVSNFARLCKLGIIMNKVLNAMYGEKSRYNDPEVLRGILTKLTRDLEEWDNNVPPHLKFSPASIGVHTSPVPAPHTYVITIMFYVLQILLHRPFVSEGHLQSALPTVALNCFSSCVAAADSIGQYLESFKRAHTFKKAPNFLFYASYVSATIHVRIAAQKQLETNAYAYLRTCFLFFDANRDDSPAATKAISIIEHLMKRVDVRLPCEQLISPDVREDLTSFPRNRRLEGGNQLAAQTTSTSNDDIGSGQLREWDFNDIDFEAILQSFDHSPNPKENMAITDDANIQQSVGEVNDPFSTSDNPSMYDMMGSDLYQSANYDVLFGLDAT